MSGFNTPDLRDRQSSAAAAKRALLEKFRTASQDPSLAEKEVARRAVAEARAKRMAEPR